MLAGEIQKAIEILSSSFEGFFGEELDAKRVVFELKCQQVRHA